jgi:hypothetical protein
MQLSKVLLKTGYLKIIYILPILGMYSEKIIRQMHKQVCVSMFITPLFFNSKKITERSKCPSVDNSLYKVLLRRIMEPYAHFKNYNV